MYSQFLRFSQLTRECAPALHEYLQEGEQPAPQQQPTGAADGAAIPEAASSIANAAHGQPPGEGELPQQPQQDGATNEHQQRVSQQEQPMHQHDQQQQQQQQVTGPESGDVQEPMQTDEAGAAATQVEAEEL